MSGGIGEADPQLALQNALAVSKVVRIDYPQEWPDALTDLIAMLRSANDSNQMHLRRGLLILLQIIKELATARLRRSQTSLQATTPEIVFLLSNIYTQKVNQWPAFLSGNGEDEGGAMDAMENSLLALKILRRLLIAGYEYPNHDKDVQQLWAHSQHQFGQFLDLISREPAVIVSPAKELIEKHMLQLSKLHVEMVNMHPAAFGLLPNSLDLSKAYWGLITKFGDKYGSIQTSVGAGDKDSKDFSERLSIQGLRILRACLKMVFSPTHSFKYRTPEIKEEQSHAVSLVKSELFTDDLVGQIASIIVTKFFVFRQADLEAWEEVCFIALSSSINLLTFFRNLMSGKPEKMVPVMCGSLRYDHVPKSCSWTLSLISSISSSNLCSGSSSLLLELPRLMLLLKIQFTQRWDFRQLLSLTNLISTVSCNQRL